MRALLVVIGLLVPAGTTVAAESSAGQAAKAQPADEIILLKVEGMT